MSNPDSFIDEVTEELRRDRLSMLLRRWGWVAALAVLVLVGGAAFNEWRKAQDAARAEAFGDALLDALEGEGGAEAVAAVPAASPEQEILRALAAAGVTAETDRPAAAAALVALGEGTADPVYRDLALTKAMLLGGTGDAARDGAILADLARAGRPFRTLAVEQQAIRAARAGDVATAASLLRLLTEDAEATDALRRRAEQTIVALGLEVEPT